MRLTRSCARPARSCSIRWLDFLRHFGPVGRPFDGQPQPPVCADIAHCPPGHEDRTAGGCSFGGVGGSAPYDSPSQRSVFRCRRIAGAAIASSPTLSRVPAKPLFFSAHNEQHRCRSASAAPRESAAVAEVLRPSLPRSGPVSPDLCLTGETETPKSAPLSDRKFFLHFVCAYRTRSVCDYLSGDSRDGEAIDAVGTNCGRRTSQQASAL